MLKYIPVFNYSKLTPIIPIPTPILIPVLLIIN